MIAAVAVAALLLGFGKAGVAGTTGPFVTVVMVLAMPADEALGLLLPMLIVADVFTVSAYWRQWEGRLLPPLLAAALLGIAIGTFLVSELPDEWLRRVIAVSLLAFVVVYVRSGKIEMSPENQGRWAFGAGSAAGFTSAIAHAGGPPIVVYLMTIGLEPKRFVATTVAFFALVNLIKIPGYLVADLFDADRIISTMWAWLLIPVGVVLGRWLVSRINRAVFERVMLVMLVAGSVVLLAT